MGVLRRLKGIQTMLDHADTATYATPEVDVAHTIRARASGATQLLDVRENDEWAESHIPGSVLIPLGDLAGRMGELDPSRPVITVCRSGRRSLIAAEDLLKGGFSDVASLAGGMIAWEKAGQPVQR